MKTSPFSNDAIPNSVIAVPPLARRDNFAVDAKGNRAIFDYLYQGGIRIFLYGGNAVLHHVRPSEYEELLVSLIDRTPHDVDVIPSVGPSYGIMMDQAPVLRALNFPTAMVLPQLQLATSSGIVTAIAHFAEAFGRPVVLYLKQADMVDPSHIKTMADEGLLSWIKYGVVHTEPSRDDYLRRIVDLVDPAMVVSGLGEQPAAIHLREYGLQGFTSGCVCVAPRLSTELLKAAARNEWDRVAAIQQLFAPLEHLRDSIHPVRVLHAAVELAGISSVGPILPPLSPVDTETREQIADAACALRESDQL